MKLRCDTLLLKRFSNLKFQQEIDGEKYLLILTCALFGRKLFANDDD